MAQKIIVSKTGNDALTATGTMLSFSSDFASHSIYNIASLSLGTTESTGTITHNLNFVPKTWVFVGGTDDGGTAFIQRIPTDNSPLTGDRVDYYATESSLVIQRYPLDGTVFGSLNFNAVIFTRSPNP